MSAGEPGRRGEGRPRLVSSPVSTDRVEHRTGQQTTVVARTAHVSARQEELSRHAAHLTREGATGELVLIDEERGEAVARRTLGATRDPTAGDGATP